ncbi:YdiU family protein [Phormidesmis priestleyi ULC007]|uniref:Protein nucleotidyltransferase YdiU n=2 Tax=Phormidesmis priestleyi TaxID=268141 RepID=A0A2T1D5D7_9CYAN|nr:YdiU family protein [Phormidesmis priestleyi]PSB15732.1 YdiU family protein [Phormidesmis priestleyi ULC007]PZO46417.1 MAG: YdiU family protein [Phormidesmis priestleyi]
MPLTQSSNPLLNLNYEPALEVLGDDFFDVVAAAEFPQEILRFRNDQVLTQLGLTPETVTDADFVEAFGKFQGRQPFLALRYHGYQFGEYNAFLGDGRGFLYGQVRGTDGELYDFGTKGSGTTPYSRGGDGRLTLKGGVREVLASEMLHRLGVKTSRCLSLVETGEPLWRGDEPSPTRSSVMIRFSRSHIRFGTFERLGTLDRKDLIAILLDHVIEVYYPHLAGERDRYALFYAELVKRVAQLVAQWMSSGFCHAVLNTDNMSITGESFDYGPFAFIDTYNPQFTAAYFDYSGRYCYGNQPAICRLNLEMLQAPLQRVIAIADMEAGLAKFESHYEEFYQQRMLDRLGFNRLEESLSKELNALTIQFLKESQVEYQSFFWELTTQFSKTWRESAKHIFSELEIPNESLQICFQTWRKKYHQALNQLPEDEMLNIANRLYQHNPSVNLVRPAIEAIWQPITQDDNWLPFYELLNEIQAQSPLKTSI